MATKTRKQKMGRPPLPSSKKRLPSMGFRPTPEIRKRLAAAASSSDRSMSQEIESRLERSFLSENFKYEEFGGQGLYWLAKAMTAAGRLTAEKMGGDFNDPVVQVEVMETMEAFIQSFAKMSTTGRTKRLGTGKAAKGMAELMETMISDERATSQTQKKTAKKISKTVKKKGK